MSKVEELAERLDPKHLKIDELREELKTQQETLEESTKPEDPKAHKEYTFEFNWKDGRGKVWKGKFTNRALSVGDRQLVGQMRGRMAAGVSLDCLDDMTQELNLMTAHMTVSLVVRPAWAKDLQALNDIRLLQEIYMEVLSHESTFLGYGTPKGPGEEKP